MRLQTCKYELDFETPAACTPEMMAEAELLTPEAVELTPIPDERGSDLTSGRQDKRLCFGGTVSQVTEQASK